MKNGTITALDIGTSKVVCFIGHIDNSGVVVITGIGHQISQGIRAGIVIDVKKAESCIISAVNAAEKMAGETIERAMVNISGSSIQSNIINVETTISGHEVANRDVKHIIKKGYEYFNRDEIEIVHCIPIDYAIDDSRGISDPIGMYGKKLSTELHVITVSSTAVRNMTNCLGRCHLNIDGYVSSPYASGLACLTEDEKNLGVIVLDIGAGNTSIAMFSAGNIIYSDSIALGGLHVTRDIAKGLSTSVTFAERIKILYGSVIPVESDEREIINFSDLDEVEENSVSKAILISIIKPRVEEILEMARKNLEVSGFYRVSVPRIVLTGGTSQIQGIKELAGHIFNKHTRIGIPEPMDGLAESTKGAAFSTCVGMMQYAIEKQKIESESMNPVKTRLKKGGGNRVVKWFKKNF